MIEWSDPDAAQKWVQKTLPQLKRPCVVLLNGPLGAGKTQVVQWFLATMGARDVQSPTFAIHQQYTTSTGPVDHLDLYRLQSDADLESIGFWDLLKQPRALLFVEWAARLPDDVWPSAWTKLSILIEVSGPTSRKVEVRQL